MPSRHATPDVVGLALKLRQAAAELRRHPVVDATLVQRLERYAEAMLRPELPRWWVEGGLDALSR